MVDRMDAGNLHMTYRGRVKDGVVILETGIKLADGTIVSLEPMPEQATQDKLAGPDDLAAITDWPSRPAFRISPRT
jgi:hypothetical protein